MKATLYVLHKPDFTDFINNRIFSDQPVSGIKNYGYMFAAMRLQLAEQGIDLSTQDINPPEESELIISVDEVVFFQTYQRRPGQRVYLMLNEPATYFPEVWKQENHGVFDRIFTYDYNLADGERYIHHYFAIDLNDYPPFQSVSEADFNQRKLLVLMAGMFQVTPPLPGSDSLLYTRYQTLLWFGRHLRQQFDFYSRGIGGNFHNFKGLGVLQRLLPRAFTGRVAELVATRRRRFIDALNKGPVPPFNKLTVIRSYRFVVCYENTRLAGYISEKIFDCLFAGCVPVYLGEPNIERFIPTGCYIDRRRFATDAELAIFLQQMSYAEYAGYIEQMRSFVEGVERQKFGSEANAWRINEIILADLAAVKLA
ncbi:MAG: hypothetical protein EOO60_00305 [Hymenobacter sp.]|nr:MAG: hypothetical protein EOO60_00305 [Hymenobacter sp.]